MITLIYEIKFHDITLALCDNCCSETYNYKTDLCYGSYLQAPIKIILYTTICKRRTNIISTGRIEEEVGFLLPYLHYLERSAFAADRERNTLGVYRLSS